MAGSAHKAGAEKCLAAAQGLPSGHVENNDHQNNDDQDTDDGANNSPVHGKTSSRAVEVPAYSDSKQGSGTANSSPAR